MYGGKTISMTSGQKAMIVATVYIKPPSGQSLDSIDARLAVDRPSSGSLTLGETLTGIGVPQVNDAGVPITLSYVYEATVSGNHTFGIQAQQGGANYGNVSVTQTTVMVIN
jgi:hypothetical protein